MKKAPLMSIELYGLEDIPDCCFAVIVKVFDCLFETVLEWHALALMTVPEGCLEYSNYSDMKTAKKTKTERQPSHLVAHYVKLQTAACRNL